MIFLNEIRGFNGLSTTEISKSNLDVNLYSIHHIRMMSEKSVEEE